MTVIDLASHKTLRSFAVEAGFKVRRLERATDSTLLFSMSTTLTSSNRQLPSRFELQCWVAARHHHHGQHELVCGRQGERDWHPARRRAVLRPQFRSSTGFGRDYVLAGRGQWGLRMQDDVTDAV